MTRSSLPLPNNHDGHNGGAEGSGSSSAGENVQGLNGGIEDCYLETGNTTDGSDESILISARCSLQHLRTRFSALR
jgi:hypothetical protein